MFINIHSIKTDQRSEMHGSLADTWVSEALRALPVILSEYGFSLGVEKKGEFIELEGAFYGEGSLECVRCLQRYPHKFNQKFRLFLYMEDNKLVGDGGEIELQTDDLDFAMISGEQIDIAEILKEQLLLTLPDYPQCNAMCQGLCVNCGVNLNKSICNCTPKKANSPFSALKDLKLKN
jgi:uncharacterized protein